MEEDDLKVCIAIAKSGIKKLHYAGEAELYQQIVAALETDLAMSFLDKYSANVNILKKTERDFLSTYFSDYGGTYLSQMTEEKIKTFGILKSEYRNSAPQPSKAEMKNIFESKIDRLFEKAGETLQKFIRLAASGYPMPEDIYNPEKTAGYTTISYGDLGSEAPRTVQTRQTGTGEIIQVLDPEYGTR